MKSAAIPLLPLARSTEQLRVLAEVFCGPVESLTGAEIARRTGVPRMTVSRELARLVEAGWVLEHHIGASRLVEPNDDLPIATALRQLIAGSVGVLPLLRDTFAGDDRIIEAFVFGSWARRWHGEPGRWPNDIDIAIVASGLSRTDSYELVADTAEAVGMEINPRVYDPAKLDDETTASLDTLRHGSVEIYHRG